ncbi:pentatricopeptide repeat-containing protein At4g14050, mitochondrial-like [Carya illinoinensis]|uniref:pentatricopeptide repeat-containing protein At4g14050, mitochondrial-like n=1 Tax=Carya illinoinensis TaxID=32201 RepID=UPI001C71A20C|nr:pentatricopeptide repeat-containing protein At4g14050, mitochondrial-like [Carya illinoinensis]
MIRIGYKRCEYDCCVYMKSLDDDSSIFLLLYVDDMLIVVKSMSDVNKLKTLLSKKIDMKDLGAAKKILGMEIHRDRTSRKLWLSQHNYVEKVLDRFSMGTAKPVSTPLANHFKLSTAQCPKTDDEVQDMSKVPYASAVRCLMYAMGDHLVVGYVDADYAGDLDDRRPTTMPEAAKEALWLIGLVKELGTRWETSQPIAPVGVSGYALFSPKGWIFAKVEIVEVYGSYTESRQMLERSIAEGNGSKKRTGCSWFEFGDEVHKFLVGDVSHSQSEQLHGFLETLSKRMRKEGYVLDNSCVLHNVDEEEKETLPCGHSEKMAITFGILNTHPGTTIRVAKNLKSM